jgi:hypothetical protein
MRGSSIQSQLARSSPGPAGVNGPMCVMPVTVNNRVRIQVSGIDPQTLVMALQ